MLKFNSLLATLLLLCSFQKDDFQTSHKASCDLYGNWSQVNFIIDVQGVNQPLVYEKELSEEHFLEKAKEVHHIYFSGQGNIDLDLDPTLSFSKKKLCYKGTKLGRYQVSNDCKTITLQSQKIQNNPDLFASCIVLYRYENIIALEQGDEIVFYLRRDPANPFFIGN